MGKKLEAKNFTKPSSINLLGEHNKMVAPHIKRRRRLAQIEKVEPAPKAETPKAEAPKAEAPKKEAKTPEKKVKKIYKRKED